ncbi:MAG TPA: GNAT family N-acetyltransferase [Anaerolineae bacterium]|nr:GNAT family N-acetyltransferase [Anaerolineae bacterium]
MRTRTHTTAAAFDSLSAEWNTLLHASVADTPFLTREWQAAYWRVLGQGVLNIVEIREDAGALVGIAPLFLSEVDGRRTLGFVGGVDPSDYLDFILARGRETEIAAPLIDALAANRDWDRLELYNIPERSPTRTWLARLAPACGWTFADEQQVVSPILYLPDSFEAYLASLDKRERHELRRKLRRAEAVEGLRWYLVDSEFASELKPEVDAFLDLMVRSRPDKADFMTPQMRRFFYEGVRAAHDGGWLQLAFLEVEGRKAATYLSFNYGDRLLIYNSGYAPDALQAVSPGIVLVARLIEQAIQQGKRAVDFMRGAEDYKYRLGAKNTWVHHLSVERRIDG